MSSIIRNTQQILKLSGFFGRRRALLTGRDTTALILLIEAMTGTDGRVILPAMCCMTRLAAVIQTGRLPVIVDVDKNMSMDPERLEKVARPGDLVVGVHLFGIPFDVKSIKEICERKECKLVEDASQAIGATIDDKPAGSVGDASILSFADRKILPTIGGGAILVDDGDLYKSLQAAVLELPDRPVAYRIKKRRLIKDTKEAFDKARCGDTVAAAEWSITYKKYGDIYKFAIKWEEAEIILTSIARFEDTVENRRDMVYLLRKKMAGAKIEFLEYPINSAPWRFTIIMSDNMTGADVMKLANTLRENGIDVSSLYLPLHWLSPVKTYTNGCPIAEHAGVRVINIRVDETTTLEHVNLAGHLVEELTW